MVGDSHHKNFPCYNSNGSVHDDGIEQLLIADSTDSAPNHPGKQKRRRFRPQPSHDKKRKKQLPETLERLKDNQKSPLQRSRQKIRTTPLVKKKKQEKEITNQQRIFLTHQTHNTITLTVISIRSSPSPNPLQGKVPSFLASILFLPTSLSLNRKVYKQLHIPSSEIIYNS